MVSFNSSALPLLLLAPQPIDQNPTIASVLELADDANQPNFKHNLCSLSSDVSSCRQSSVVKLGTWGGDGGIACDLTVAPQRLQSITIRWGKVIDWISFSYRDRSGKLHTAGPWGGNGKGEGTETMTLEPSEYVTAVEWSVGPFTFKNVERCITCIKIVTNLRSFGPWGHAVDSTHHNLPVLGNASVVGMFARAGDFLDAIGFYILPSAFLPAVKPTDPNNQNQGEKGKDSSQEESQKEKENDSSQEEKKDSIQEGNEDSGQEEKEEEKCNQEETEKEKSDQEETEKDSSHEGKENGKS